MNIFRCLFWVPLMLSQAVSAHAETATGAGSSAAAPIYRGWAKAYSQAVGHAVEYESIGSSAGMKKIQQQAVGFGATDVYPSEKDLAEHGLLALPVAITGIAPVVNLPKMQGVPLRMTGDVLSRIFMGEITRWNAREIVALNTDIALPDLPIKVVVRADGSGTTYNFADYLGKVDPKWKSAYGAKTSLSWPAGFMAVKGSEGVAKGVRETAGSIGYVDYGYVTEYGLVPVQMRNADGVYVKPSIDAFRSALSNSEWAASGSFNTTLTQRPGKSSWPITMGTFVVFPKVARNPEQTASALRFVIWSFLNGDSLVQENNFVRLPDRVQASAFKQITAVRDPQGKTLGMGLLSSIHPPSP
ncbi:MAG: phosphate ABC transporter substrate-binding protein PstS [Acidovorax sp.]|jgi:phosphate transport system substrate-binding protein|uniref:phosphate ABC transporter substrate-binding protein PstS n=1 Tax=Acidovorax sp. TaxID=1872122 RepID=UPI0026390340|nr:phosphate ABC transporter substrate-binding protein PstS [Acidovorax sp.]MDH4427977.1 phosphate ABC transporter substrate-binding protein PstS [Acidovorax sp.]MDH4448395.1 phosphate ABC transporter substrate-binding protein PstS [Acidovorax sp.]